jgi:hypothetical protein
METTTMKRRMTMIGAMTALAALLIAVSAARLSAADPDVYMNAPVVHRGGAEHGGEHGSEGAAADMSRGAVANADADIYMRGEGAAVPQHQDDDVWARVIEVLADLLAGLGR